MPFNGSGIFSRLYNWITDANNGIPMTPSRFDGDANDMAAALSNCVTRNGQSPPTANLPMGGFKLTGMAAGTAASDSVNFGQISNGESSTTGSGIPGFDPSINYVAQTIGWAQLQGAINIGWFVGADKTGATDMSSIMNAAALLGHAIYLPAGTWAMNWTITKPVVITGEGARSTIVKPFSNATAAMTYNPTSAVPYWTYSSLVQSINS